MKFSFDHVVHYVENPEEAIEVFNRKGLHAVHGGKHGNGQTYNNLSYFDLSFIEFIGVLDKDLFKQTEHPRFSLLETMVKDQLEEGISRFVLRTNDIHSAATSLKNKGLEVDGPLYRKRKRPDGKVLEWHILLIGDPNSELDLPYIIQWSDSDEEIRKELTASGALAPHPIGAVFSHVSFAVHDVDATVKRWSTMFGLQVGESFLDEGLQAKCSVLELDGGNLIFCSPIGEGIVADVLKNRGEKTFRVTLKSEQLKEQFELFKGQYELRG